MSRCKDKQIITIKNAFKRLRKINDQIFKTETTTLIKLHLLYPYFYRYLHWFSQKQKIKHKTHNYCSNKVCKKCLRERWERWG